MLFLRCALLVLGIVMDTADFFPGWNVHDGYLQMTPSLVLLLMSFLVEFTYLIPKKRVLAVVGLVSSVVYMLISFFVVLYYAYPRYVADLHGALQLNSLFQLSDVNAPIVDTRPSLLIVLFIFFLIVDTLVVFRSSLKLFLGVFRVSREDPKEKVDAIDIKDSASDESTETDSKEDPKATFRFDSILRSQDNPAAIDFRAISKKKT